MNLPNILTLFRMFLIPIFILVFFSNIKNNIFYSIILFLIAGLTDVLDGYIARKKNLVTKWGIVLDPLADKLMLLTVLTCLTINDIIPLWIIIIVSIKELAMIIAGAILYNKDFIIPSNIFGKMATLMFYISIFILNFNSKYGEYLLDIAVLSALLAFTNYLLFYLKQK
ncbi:cardiolipin synthase [Clostridium tetanomorphum]|uniref:CDP-diacylglycerol--glycerol-3-phosphate 3-phosphatidyltransferase n=1 Tax=Clostridium tetanomorphum TaxID=1553 RepID=UPI000449F574|nr:CDP-diacylglycerol--glycerol-3-phosphate 3-phosphatidyltransferase [Clostridium tetanomorphum]KAJ49007.1 phosphatidylglycerophosphate synthase [Clostridium tetanomorphum DSM 665]KAJ49541.1 phosphatidylglycerophosphate synthase [Clostridium tetanomorphum DSM 665]MBP1866358.1 cardiolipin synthase [Clostridium tetanomorphum]NRS86535.1 cardiolipin synthase [Clostridium tetanomorphum]SQC00962.1 phosphatidylglycerophosphate synthase [Clostridium tetanomorphum]